MAKQSSVQKQLNRLKLVKKFQSRRQTIQSRIKQARLENAPYSKQLRLSQQLQMFPRNSCPTRLTNRCSQTGRVRAYTRYFGLSRVRVRELAHQGFLPGVVKASW